MEEEERTGDPGEVLPSAERFGKQPLKCLETGILSIHICLKRVKTLVCNGKSRSKIHPEIKFTSLGFSYITSLFHVTPHPSFFPATSTLEVQHLHSLSVSRYLEKPRNSSGDRICTFKVFN